MGPAERTRRVGGGMVRRMTVLCAGSAGHSSTALREFVGLAFAGRFRKERLMIIDAGLSIAGTPAPSARYSGVGGGAGTALVIPPHNVIVVVRNRRPRVAGGDLVFCVPADAVRLGATRSLRDFSATRFKFFM